MMDKIDKFIALVNVINGMSREERTEISIRAWCEYLCLDPEAILKSMRLK